MNARSITAPLIAIAAALLPAPRASAQERTTCTAIAFTRDAEGARAAAQLMVLLESAVRRNGAFVYVDLADAADPKGSERRFSLSQDAADAFAHAKEAYDGLEFEGAADHARRAATLASNGPLADRRESLSSALLLSAAARYYTGDEKAARNDFDLLLAVDPGVWLDPRAWSPEVEAVALDEKFRLQPLRKATAHVDARPVNARIFVDGSFAGISPLDLPGLTPGAHRVTAQAPFFSHADGSLDASGTLTLRLEPTEAGRPLAQAARKANDSFGSTAGDEALRALGHVAGAQEVLAASLEAHAGALTVHLERISVADGHRQGAAQGSIALDSAAGLNAADALIRSALRDE
ncbi:MAG: PEGA domain-containing protein [Deltaproteobacteria bacterium]|nr:PEGA domain-containing protein [Deltaproteobacteria bacterium]